MIACGCWPIPHGVSASTRTFPWTAEIPRALDRHDSAIASGRLQTTTVPVSIIFGRNDPNLNSDVAQHISGLFKTQICTWSSKPPIAAPQ